MFKYEFRGMKKGSHHWVYGYLVGFTFGGNTMYNIGEFDSSDRVPMIPIQESSIGRFIGITDINGKKVYTGDIVHAWGGESCQGFTENDCIICLSDDNPIDIFFLSDAENIEVIGNQMDNPDMWEESKLKAEGGI